MQSSATDMRPVGHCVISHLQLLSLSARNLPISLYVVVPVFLGLPSNSYANDRVKAHSVPTDCVILSRLHVSDVSLQVHSPFSFATSLPFFSLSFLVLHAVPTPQKLKIKPLSHPYVCTPKPKKK